MKSKVPAPRTCASEPGKCSDKNEIARIAALFDLAVLDETGVIEGRALAAQLLGESIAPAENFVAVQRAAGAALLGFFEDGKMTGLLAAFPLSAKGHEHLQAGSFDPINLDLGLICWNGETPEAYYGWGFVASTKDGARAVVKATAAIHQALFWATPTYARATTADGLRALSSLGFRPVGWNDPQMLWLAPREAGLSR